MSIVWPEGLSIGYFFSPSLYVYIIYIYLVCRLSVVRSDIFCCCTTIAIVTRRPMARFDLHPLHCRPCWHRIRTPAAIMFCVCVCFWRTAVHCRAGGMPSRSLPPASYSNRIIVHCPSSIGRTIRIGRNEQQSHIQYTTSVLVKLFPEHFELNFIPTHQTTICIRICYCKRYSGGLSMQTPTREWRFEHSVMVEIISIKWYPECLCDRRASDFHFIQCNWQTQ